jgi:hypothetical protein
MVNLKPNPERRTGRHAQQGMLMTELVMAMAIFVIAVLPLACSFAQEQKLLRAYYHRAVAMEIVDGEIEALAAGEWRSFNEGAHEYAVRANSVTNLPPGKFLLTVSGKRIRLEWLPEGRGRGGKVIREAIVK